MKKLLSIALVAVAVLSGATPSFAASVSNGPINMSASVPGALTLSLVLKKNDFAGAVVTSMDFGELVNVGTGTLRSSTTSTTGTGAVAAFISANSQGLPYTIKQTGTALSNGTTTLPSGACVVKPVYAAADNGGQAQPAGAVLGTGGSWVATDKVLYQSETGTAAIRTIQAYYSVTDDPAAGATTGVPINQAPGSYTGTVTITVTA